MVRIGFGTKRFRMPEEPTFFGIIMMVGGTVSLRTRRTRLSAKEPAIVKVTFDTEGKVIVAAKQPLVPDWRSLSQRESTSK